MTLPIADYADTPRKSKIVLMEVPTDPEVVELLEAFAKFDLRHHTGECWWALSQDRSQP